MLFIHPCLGTITEISFQNRIIWNWKYWFDLATMVFIARLPAENNHSLASVPGKRDCLKLYVMQGLRYRRCIADQQFKESMLNNLLKKWYRRYDSLIPMKENSGRFNLKTENINILSLSLIFWSFISFILNYLKLWNNFIIDLFQHSNWYTQFIWPCVLKM